MQGIEATFDDLSFEGGDSPQRVLPKIVPGVAALALAGAVSVWALHWLGPAAPDAVFSRWSPATTVAAPAISRPFGDIAIDAQPARRVEVGPYLRRLRAGGEPRSRSRPPRSRCRASKLFPPLRRPRRPGACRCRRGGICPRSVRRKASPCRRPVRPSLPLPASRRARAPCVTARYGCRSSSCSGRQSQRFREAVRMGALVLAGRGFRHHHAHCRHSAGGC